MRKKLLLLSFICAFLVVGFVAAFTLSSVESKPEVLTAEDLTSVIKAENLSAVTKNTAVISESSIPSSEQTSVIAEPPAVEFDFINEEGKTLAERINVPQGFERTEYAEDSFGAFVRSYKLKEHGTAVYYFDGRKKNTNSHIAVFDMFLADRDLQQCADSIMRLIAEYYYSAGQYEKIFFDFVNGFECRYDKWIEGSRVGFEDNEAFWKEGGTKGATAGTFESYINTVFAYASTLSLEASAETVSISELQIGDVFINGGSPGHVVMIADICENAEGEKAFLLAQGFMPAQSFHLLKNPANDDDPWYYANEISYPFVTPEYTFPVESLKRLEALN